VAQVNITIAGKTYRMACDDGQEQHLESLGERLNDIIEQLRARFGEIGDQRLTVMAAITMADQYSESERRLRQLEGDVAGLEEARAAVTERASSAEAGLAQVVEALATRLEAIADRLNGGGQAPE
jgi:cell division protein ZapA